MNARHGQVGFGALLLVWALAGCDALVPDTSIPDPPAPPASNANVDLPPVPNLELVDVPSQYEDGSYSVSGLLLDRTELRDTALAVSAVLVTVYECETPDQGVEGEVAGLAAPADDAATVGSVRPGCLQPHVYVADSLRARQRLLITGYDATFYEPQLTPGARYTFRGHYRQQTRGFISTEDGLIVADAVEGPGVEAPPEPEPAP